MRTFLQICKFVCFAIFVIWAYCSLVVRDGTLCVYVQRNVQFRASLEGLLVEPGPEDGQGGGVLDLGLGPPEGAVLVPQGVRGQHDGQLQLDRLLHVRRGHDEL